MTYEKAVRESFKNYSGHRWTRRDIRHAIKEGRWHKRHRESYWRNVNSMAVHEIGYTEGVKVPIKSMEIGDTYYQTGLDGKLHEYEVIDKMNEKYCRVIDKGVVSVDTDDKEKEK